MRIRRGPEIPKKVGEYLLDTIAGGQSVQALHVALSSIAQPRGVERAVDRLEQFLGTSDRVPRVTAFCMPTGDLFMFAGTFTSEALRQLTSSIALNLVPAVDAAEVQGVCHIYDVPDHAIPLRRLVKSFLNLPEGGASAGPATPPAAPAGAPVPASPPATEPPPATSAPDTGARSRPAAELEGPLTLPMIARLRAVIETVELSQFVNQQDVYTKGRVFTKNYTEYYFDISRLRRTYFPRVDLEANDGLFVELTSSLDDLMLVNLLRQRPARQGRIALNLSLATVHASTFEDFSRHLSLRERENIVLELHWLEILRDLQDGGQAVRALNAQGYGVAVDRITIAVMPYLNLGAFEFAFLKVRFDRAALAALGARALAALRQAPADKLVLTQCDDRRALALGEALAITNYQGFLIDQLYAEAA